MNSSSTISSSTSLYGRQQRRLENERNPVDLRDMINVPRTRKRPNSSDLEGHQDKRPRKELENRIVDLENKLRETEAISERKYGLLNDQYQIALNTTLNYQRALEESKDHQRALEASNRVFAQFQDNLNDRPIASINSELSKIVYESSIEIEKLEREKTFLLGKNKELEGEQGAISAMLTKHIDENDRLASKNKELIGKDLEKDLKISQLWVSIERSKEETEELNNKIKYLEEEKARQDFKIATFEEDMALQTDQCQVLLETIKSLKEEKAAEHETITLEKEKLAAELRKLESETIPKIEKENSDLKLENETQKEIIKKLQEKQENISKITSEILATFKINIQTLEEMI